MKISGFTVVRNSDKYYFPIRESIESILPLVDEFIVALGKSDPDDHTEEIIRSIPSDKVKIIDRGEWDEKLFRDAAILREETTFALSQCKGDWCFYLQADEVVHEDDLPLIKDVCEKYLNDKRVEGFLFKYLHFFGDYDHYQQSHKWYPLEIRIIRNHIGVESYLDAQSFRIHNTGKLKVIETNARIFHYGWVRPPHTMKKKGREQAKLHYGIKRIESNSAKDEPDYFEYGPLGRLNIYKGTHPKVMHERIKKLNWKQLLDYGKKLTVSRPKLGHERTKNIMLSFIENNLMRGKQLFGWTNWKILRK